MVSSMMTGLMDLGPRWKISRRVDSAEAKSRRVCCMIWSLKDASNFWVCGNIFSMGRV